ncbi:Similar to ZNF839: Zinc finger protein 839 (Homo sapiens) [Cotesia congregata]|uniref:Similar to ZNF839: Zinc finger protein 839 (Homo sapiens) n=1 Tax=Cotesia congregata TaxID=51543 RepID=A0A8J2MU94_COTCN|nr:Similar to ZNF839: Zinc finger protein 839 (Homo sapiens) [Cotesia congregata]
MAEIANSTVFTNGVTCNTTDLLQRAFQEVINDDDHEFVTFLTDGDASHTIHLTQAQAAELNLNFEVDSCANDQPNELSYQSQQQQQQQQCQTNTLNGYHNTQSQSKFDSASPGTPETIDYETARWSIDDKLDGHDADTASKPITIDDITSSSAKTIDFEPNTRSNVQALFIHSDSSKKAGLSNNISSNFNEIQLAINGKNIQQNFSTAALSSSSPQVLQKLPVYLPSSQFIIKPAQTILKTSKSIQLISNSKLINGNNGSQHQNQNSVLLPKVSTLLNSVNSHVFKGTSVASQVVHGNSLSAQLLTPQIITCESSNQRVTNTNTGGNTSGQCNTSNNNNISIINNKNGNLIANGVRSQSLGNTQQIRLLPRVTGAIQETNAGQFTAVVNKTAAINESVNGKMTAGSLIGGKISTGVISSKTAQFTPRMVTASIGKLATTATKVPINSLKSSITFPAGTTIRPQNFRSVNAGLIQRNGTSVSTSVSILKPQPKVVPKQNLGVGSPISAVLNGASTGVGSLQKIVKVAPQSLSMDTVKRVQSNEAKRSSDLVMNKMDVKKPKTVGMLSSGTAGQTNLAKPLGSNENPIQIVQQGHTFHSSQKLTQSQLKQIAHVLQQRSQESSIPNEKIVYRVVFPEELDLRIRNPMNLLKSRGGKRGRPKKKPTKSMIDERKKHVARTRSGRLSRPPKHIVRDYKHLHHLDFMEPDLDDSDGGYSDYYVNNDKIDSEEAAKDLLTGYEGPKRKISDHFRCPTCNKIYLGRSRMTKHFELYPDHGSPDQLPPMTAEPELKQSPQYPQDQFKRKGKRRGPWAYITPEAKSERRQIKLKEALVACDTEEILKIAAKPVLNAQSLFDLMVIKSDNCLKTFLSELKTLVDTARERVSTMLSPENDDEDKDEHVLELNDDLLCDTLGLVPGYYNVNEEIFKSSNQFYNTSFTTSTDEEPPSKLSKIDNDDGKENIDKRLNHFGDNNINLNVNVSNFLNDRKFESVNVNCPEVLTALTLMPRNSSPINSTDSLSKSHSNLSTKLLISNPEIQSQILDNPGFQKIQINTSKHTFKKLEPAQEGFTKLNGSKLDITNSQSSLSSLSSLSTSSSTSSEFTNTKLNDNNYEQNKIDNCLTQTFIKLEPMQQIGFVKLENGTVGTYQQKNSTQSFKLQVNNNSYTDNTEQSNSCNDTQTFTKGFQKIIPKIIAVSSTASDNSSNQCNKTEAFNSGNDSNKDILCKLSNNLQTIMNESVVPIITSNCDANLFVSADNLDITKMTNYDLDLLTSNSVIDKNLMMDEKLVEQLQLVDQTRLVDELVSERLKNIMPDNILDSNLISSNTANLDTELDFEALSEEFNRNTRS